MQNWQKVMMMMMMMWRNRSGLSDEFPILIATRHDVPQIVDFHTPLSRNFNSKALKEVKRHRLRG
jgi:hypothetical protein